MEDDEHDEVQVQERDSFWMSQKEVADALGMTKNEVAEIERRALRKLSRIIPVSFPELLSL